MRGALVDLSELPDFDGVLTRFMPNASVPYQYMGGTYALPVTQMFHMMFYRTDIFDDLGLTVPTTWTEFAEIIPEFQIRNMTVGLPGGLGTFLVFLFQRDAPLYLADGRYINFAAPEAVDAFAQFTNFYILHRLPVDFDFANRFRSGEMPLGFADFTLYNTFAVFAPEIRGNWAFTNVPGTVKPDGSINRTIPAGGSAVIMMRSTSDGESAWEYMKWWTSTQVQAAFGISMQSIMGDAAMHATANQEALAMLPWHPRDFRRIQDQWQHVRGIPEVPGGYYVPRAFGFAFNRLINNHRNQTAGGVFDAVDPGDVLTDYITAINSELHRKRREFGVH
jgi:ABC-type glycerol-3-phosphate transport system substrate-binding protein